MNKINVICKTKTTSFGYKLFKVFITFSLVDIAWIFFRADSVHQAFHYIERMFRYRDWWSFFDQSLYKMTWCTADSYFVNGKCYSFFG